MRWRCEKCKNYKFCKRAKMRICVKDYTTFEIVMDIIGAVATITANMLIITLALIYFLT